LPDELPDARTPRSAVVISPSRPYRGGLGTAAAEFADGLRAHGISVEFAGLPDEPSRLRSLVARRPLRRFTPLVREVDRREVLRTAPPGWDLAYAVPNYLPRDGGALVLHHATEHPRVAAENLRRARAVAGGGKHFYSRLETPRLEAEIRRAHVIRAQSGLIAGQLADAGVEPERIVVASAGVDLTRFRPGPKVDGLQVAFVGANSLWKGIDQVVALDRLLRPDGRLRVIGGPVDPWSRRLTEGLDRDERRDAAALMAESHALVLPSASDGFGRVVLEAMAAGTVPFVTPHVGAAEVVAELDPRLVQPRDEFAERVRPLLDELDLVSLGARAREIAEGYDRGERGAAAARAVLDAVIRLRA
jgi:glycosyltransferase involved in cell wall biosynthesis